LRALAARPGRDRLAALALGVTRAGQELAEAAGAKQHRCAALRALLICLLRRLHSLFAFQRPCALALREAGAGQETAAPSPADDHWAFAFRALLGGCLLRP